ncbi:MAG TPA: hypothetical protein VN943_06665 [Candidatus Acidoferrum sp.]|nr:hypothetical protein [Candidatus Acidoferrum sp.]
MTSHAFDISPTHLCLTPGHQQLTTNSLQLYFWAQRYAQVVDSPAPTFQNDKTGDFTRKPVNTRMPHDPNPPSAVDQAVSRALRENLERIQRTTDELHQAVADVVAACASSRPTNALPSMLRAQTAAASISAALDVMSRFVSSAVQGSPRSPFEAEMSRIASTMAAEPAPPRMPELHAEPALPQTFEDDAAPPSAVVAEPEYEGEFDVNRLSPEEQELHRRANRVAKVSMQDIKMLRPEQVRLGRENKDLCIRLRDDIEKAHREYDRRFKPIMDHPVDYFYRWLVEILAEGDAHALGEYPYASPMRQH